MKQQVKIMGILNLTPDSFYDGGKYDTIQVALQKVAQYLSEGADIIDIGAYSSRPGATHITQEEESARLKPVLKAIKSQFPEAVLSLDTFRSSIARMGIEHGVSMINDISGGEIDADMYALIAHYKVTYVLMHMKGTPQDMQHRVADVDITKEVYNYFQKKLDYLTEIGVNDVILDVGFGFGKSINQNFDLLRNLADFKVFGKPLLVGISRKSMLYKTLNSSPDQMLNATSIAHTLAVLNGASLLRVHDVKEAKEVIEIVKKYDSY